ncbi:major facilitator superfamily domain-containing protein [Mycena leptocephala]|nr:major facilitator superfamily domain-containing protein [Mycena leptocephala]
MSSTELPTKTMGSVQTLPQRRWSHLAGHAICRIEAIWACPFRLSTTLDLHLAPAGNARIAGMAENLKLSGMRYQLAAAAFFITYSLLEIPGWSYYPFLFLSPIALAWGISPMAIYVFVTLGAFGGLLAFCIEKMDGLGGLHGWSWIFLLEGLPHLETAKYEYQYPSTATFLTPTERERLLDILQRDTVGEPSHFEMKFVWETLGNPKSWLQALTFLGLFLPQTLTNYQSLTIPPYAAGCVATILLGALSDRVQMRGPFVAGLSLFGIAGFTMLLATDAVTQPAAGYAGCVIVAVGVYPCIPLVQAWSAGNAGGSLKKAVIFALIGMVGNFGGICASFLYRIQDTPRFRLGHGVGIGFLCLAFLGSSFATLLYRRVNQTRERLGVKENIELDRKAECSALGTDSPVSVNNSSSPTAFELPRNLHFESNPGNIRTGGKLLEGSGVLLFKPKPKGIKKSTLAILCVNT